MMLGAAGAIGLLLGTNQSAEAAEPIPAEAVILESQQLNPERTLVLWMLNPTKHPRESPGETYTCPEYTRGHYYSGAARVSLVHPATKAVIHTLEIKGDIEDEAEGDPERNFDLPYLIEAGFYYHVEGAAKGEEGKPTIMHLKDYNGDGEASEFALFDAEACMGLQTTVIGYSKRHDKVVQYPVQVETVEEGKRSTAVQLWVDYLFSKKPKSAGRWKYEIDYRGRSGTLDKHEFRYNKEKEWFEGRIVSTEEGGPE